MASRSFAPLGVFLFALALYGLTGHGYVDIEDTEICYQSGTNLLDHGSLAIPDTENGRKLIAEKFYVMSGGDGHWYPMYPLLQVLLHVPGIVLGRAMSGLANEHPLEVVRLFYSLPNVLFGALLAVVIFGLARRLGCQTRIASVTAMLGAAGTMLWPQCQGTFVDPPLALFTSASVLCLFMHRPDVAPGGRSRTRLHWPLLAGLLHGAGCSLRPSALLLLLPSAWYLRQFGLRAMLAFAVPVALVIAGLTWLDVAVFARPFHAGYFGWAELHPPVVTASYTHGLYGLLISDGCGLFTLSPLLLLAVMAFPGLRRQSPAAAHLIAGQFAVLTLFLAAYDGWYGGWCWGPRYLLPAVPLLAATVGCWLQRRGLWRTTLAVALAGLSLGIQVLAVAVPHRIHMVVRSTSDAHIYMFYQYARFSPVASHAYILGRKLRGEPEVYTLREVFGEPDDRPIRITEWPEPQIERYSAGFQHFASVRVFAKGHWLAGLTIIGAGILSLAGGGWLALRSSGSPSDQRPPRNDGDVGSDRAIADEGPPEQPRHTR